MKSNLLQTATFCSKFLLLGSLMLVGQNSFASEIETHFEDMLNDWNNDIVYENEEDDDLLEGNESQSQGFSLYQESVKKIYNPDEVSLDEASLRKVLLIDIFASHPFIQNEFFQNRVEFDKISWQDLNLLSGTVTKKDKSLVNTLANPKTTFGKAYLGTKLTTPTTDTDKIYTRQKKVSALRSNPELREKLNSILAKLVKPENAILTLFSQQSTLFNSEYQKNLDNLMLHQWGFTKELNNHQWAIGFKKRMAVDLVLVTLFGFGSAMLIPPFTPLGALYIYLSFEQTKMYRQQLAFLKKRLQNLSILLSSAKRLASELHQAGLDKQFASEYQLLGKIYKSKDPKVREVISLLQKPSLFNTNPIFSDAAESLKAYYYLKTIRHKLHGIVVAVGAIDANVSLADKIEEVNQLGRPATFTNATFANSNRPGVVAYGMWNPFINPDYVVVNDVNLGKLTEAQTAATVVLTGPNAGGKSTYMTGTAISVLMAQTLGVVPGQNHTQTPFVMINTYMNVTDDIAAGNSLFMAEVLRAQEHIKKIMELPEASFSFSIFDELFTGTNPLEGAAASYSIAKRIARNNNSVTMLATHFKNLTRLEDDLGPDFVQNYKVSIKKDIQGKIVYPYKISRGASNQNIAIDILEEQGFDPEMIEEARRIVNQGL